MPDKIRVALEGAFAILYNLGLPLAACRQLQQSGVKLYDGLWIAESSGSGVSINLYLAT